MNIYIMLLYIPFFITHVQHKRGILHAFLLPISITSLNVWAGSCMEARPGTGLSPPCPCRCKALGTQNSWLFPKAPGGSRH